MICSKSAASGNLLKIHYSIEFVALQTTVATARLATTGQIVPKLKLSLRFHWDGKFWCGTDRSPRVAQLIPIRQSTRGCSGHVA
jgi:hypothetical protein